MKFEYGMGRETCRVALKSDGVFLKKTTASGTETTRVADPIKVRAFGTRWSDKATLVEIRFKTIHGDYRSEIFEFSYLQPERWRELKIRVGDPGYRWPADRLVSTEILRQLAAADPTGRFCVVSAPGWYDSEFVLPAEVFSPLGRGTDFRIDQGSDAHIGAFLCKGSLKGWQQTVAKPARKSSCLRVAVAAAFAAPLVRPMGMDSFAINWFSNTSDGKTTMLFVAASVPGLIDAEGLPGWADSEAGIEDRARGHRDCLVPLDESADGSGKVPLEVKAKMLAFMIARNRPRKLSKKYERANALQGREFRTIAQSSSEVALSKVAIDAGARRQGGEEVRFVDVCASEPGSLGIFDGRVTARSGRTDRETTKELIDQLKVDAEANQGTAFREFMRKYVRDPKALQKVKAYKAEFETKVSVPSSNAALRIRSNFALIWAAAAMAIDYGILPWKKAPTLSAVEKCLSKALSEMAASNATTSSPADAATSVLMTLNKEIEKADLRKIILRKKITPQKARRRRRADGFRVNGDIYVKPDRLRRWLPSQRERTILKDAGVLRTRRNDAATIEQVIAGIPGKPRYYVLDISKLKQLSRKKRSRG
jgi:uncharacterized protein (DUF927 family)